MQILDLYAPPRISQPRILYSIMKTIMSNLIFSMVSNYYKYRAMISADSLLNQSLNSTVHYLANHRRVREGLGCCHISYNIINNNDDAFPSSCCLFSFILHCDDIMF